MYIGGGQDSICLGFDKARGKWANELPLDYGHDRNSEDQVVRALSHNVDWSELQMDVIENAVAFLELL